MTATPSRTTAPQRLCPTCGELLVSSRCPECAPIEPARSYSERVTQPITGAPGALGMAVANAAVDVRRSTGEWVTGPDDREPSTRRAHPTLVRSALAEAEERAKDKVARSALVQRVHTTTKPRLGSTAPRLRPVTPLPPAPRETEDWSDAADPSAIAAPVAAESAPVQVSSAVRIEGVDAPARVQAPAAPAAVVLQMPAPAAAAPKPQIEPPARAAPASVVHDEASAAPEESNRKAQLFWFALLASAGVLLVFAAI